MKKKIRKKRRLVLVMTALRVVVSFQKLYMQLSRQLCSASRAGANVAEGEGGGGDGAEEEGETADSSLEAVYSCTCLMGGGGGGGGIEGVAGEEEA